MEAKAFMKDMIQSELEDVVGTENVSTKASDREVYGVDYFWISRMWADRGMPMAAALLQAGLTADCTGLEMAPDGVLTQTRPACGSSVTARIVSSARPQMATVRPGIFAAAALPQAEPAPLVRLALPGAARVQRLGFVPAQAGPALTEAAVIFAGGMGIGGRAGFAQLQKLAAACGGCVAATRAAVNAGYAPYAWQVGQTGVAVRPRLYVAVGISGAVQHLAGMSGARRVAAVNTDPHAPIWDYADYGILGDWHDCLSQLEKYL